MARLAPGSLSILVVPTPPTRTVLEYIQSISSAESFFIESKVSFIDKSYTAQDLAIAGKASEREMAAPSQTTHPGSSSNPLSRTTTRSKISRSHFFRLNRQRTETDALLAAQHDEEEFADSDGLYPPHCTWTSRDQERVSLPTYHTEWKACQVVVVCGKLLETNGPIAWWTAASGSRSI